MDWTGFQQRAGSDALLARHAAGASFRLLLRWGTEERLLLVHEGRIESMAPGPLVMPRCDFALEGSAAAWERFARPAPAPRDQDIFAFFRRGEITLTGDTRKFYAHLLWLKLLLLNLREGA